MIYGRREMLKLAPGRSSAIDGAYWLHVSREAMACRFEVTLPEGLESAVAEASLALDEAGRIEAWLTPFRAESELSQLNRLAGDGEVVVAEELFGLLARSCRLAAETGGAFDITAGPLSRVWGFTRRAGRVPTPEELAVARALVGSGMIRLTAGARTVRFLRPGMEINPGGVGKGYALDRLAGRLRRAGIPALLTAGYSSMLALGEWWTVGIRHPRLGQTGQAGHAGNSKRRLATIRLRDLALGTSGSEEQSFTADGVSYGHIIDPRSGWPAPAGASVTVIAPSAERADALATAFYVGGRQMAAACCAANPGTVVIWLDPEADRPVVIGGNPQCEVTISDE